MTNVLPGNEDRCDCGKLTDCCRSCPTHGRETSGDDPGRLTRDALIEAAAAELPTYVGRGGALDWEKRETAAAVLDAVLPLIAGAVESMPIQFSRDRDVMDRERGVQLDAAALVRSLVDDGSTDR